MFKIILICLVLRVWAEPQCSKFHYEEQLLEKMVRMEFQMEQRNKELETRNKELEQCLADKKNDIQGLLGRLDAALSDVAEQKKAFQHIVDQGSDVFSKFMDNATRIMNSALKDLSKGNVVFYARKVTNLNPSENEVTVFQETLRDNTGSYNNNTGEFTTPVDGIYIFTVHMCSATSNYADFTIMHNSAKYAQSRNAQSKRYGAMEDCTSVQAMIAMKLGDSVYSTITSGSSKLVEAENQYWNSFGGVRVSGV